MSNCIICDIVATKIPAYIVFENDQWIAFLDHRPVFKGHCLLAPKQHFQTFYDLPPDHLGPYFQQAQKLGKAIEKAMQATGTFIAINNIVSQSIPHLHTHLIPRKLKDGLKGFFWPRIKYADESEIERTALAIKNILATK